MVAVGYAVMPVIPAFEGLTREINKHIADPLAKASKKAGEGIEKGVGSGVEAAADKVEKAQYRVKKATNELADAESKRSAEVLKSEAAAKQLEAAESKLTSMKESGAASAEQLAKAEADVLNKRARVESAAQNVEKAERGVEKAMTESARASESLKNAQNELDSATDGSAEATKKFGDAASDADKKSGGLELSMQKIAVAGAAVAGAVAGATKAAYDIGATFDDAYDTIRIGTGASGEAFEELQQSMRNVAENSIGVGGDLGEIGTTLADLNTRLGVTGEPLEKLTAQFQQLKGMGMEVDINAVTGAFQQFGVEVDQMPGMMDTLFQISQATGREMNDLVGNLSKSGPALQQFGFGLEESAGLLGALDKAGLDSEKTLGSMTKALGEFAKEGKNPQEALWGTIEKIDELTRTGNSMEAIDLANKIFGAKGGAGFVAAVESGQFAYEDFMDSIGASADTIDGLANETADFAERWDQVKLQVMLALEPIATAVFNAMVPALEKAQAMTGGVTEALKGFADWVQKSRSWLEPLGVALGVLAAGMAALALQTKILAAGGFVKFIVETTKATKIWTLATQAQETIQKILNATIKANPMGALVAAITAVVAALTYFFTQTEKGRELWASFTEALAAGWQRVEEFLVAGFEVVRGAFAVVGEAIGAIWGGMVSAFQSGWAVVKAVFDAFVEAGTWLVQVVSTVVFTPMILAWEAMSWAVQAAWENIIKPTFDAIAAGATWLWENGVQPVLELIRAGWEALGEGLRWVYDSLILPVWDLFTAGLSAVWEGAQVGFDLIQMGWQALGDGLMWVYDHTIGPVWDAFGAGLSWLHDNVVEPVTSWIGDKWRAMGDGLSAVKDFIVDGVFGGFKSALDTLQGWFQSAVDGIKGIWDGIKRVTAAPVRFVVETVYNNGIRRAWNLVARFTGLGELEPAQLGDLGGYARGGVLPGWTPGRDVYRFIDPVRGAQIDLGGGEAVMVPEFTRAVGGERGIEALNRAARSGALSVQRFADGGVVDGENKKGSRIGGLVQKLWNGVMNFLPSWDGPGLIGQLPGAMLKHMADAAWSAVKNAVSAVVGFFTGGDDEEQGFASGGVLPGWSPGRDIHHFTSPTAGRLALSGGESIMVPEWTRDVGGPAAVERMNRAARAGRSSTVTAGARAFADGGTYWAPAGDYPRDALVGALDEINRSVIAAGTAEDVGAQFDDALAPIAAELAVIADASTLEGIAFRAVSSQLGEIAGMVGLNTTSTVVKSLIDAEDAMLQHREAQLGRVSDIARREEELAQMHQQLGELMSGPVGLSDQDLNKLRDAEAAVDAAYAHVYGSYEEAAEKIGAAEEQLERTRSDLDAKLMQEEQKRADEIVKLQDQISKSEADLVKARKESARNLDMLIYDLAPGIHESFLGLSGMLEADMPELAGAFAELAMLTGPAGVSVGMAVQGIKTGINLVKTIGTAIGDFLERIHNADAQMYQSMVQAIGIQHEWAKMVDDQAAAVVSLRVAWVEAQVALRDASWKTRMAQADVVRAQLQGVKTVAEVEAKLEAERIRVAKIARLQFDDMSLAYDRYRWMEHRSMEDRLDLYAQVTPEILALESEVNAAKLNALAAQKQASLDALAASYEQQKAAMALQQTQANLALQTQQLALMQREFFGMDQAESLKAMNTMQLRQELAELQAQIGKNSWRISYAATGAKAADRKREEELRRQIAEREGTGNVRVAKTSGMAFFGYAASAQNAAKNAGYGRAEAAMFKAQEEQALLNIKQQEQQLRQQIEQSKLFEQYQQQVGSLTAEIESLKTGASAAQYTADYFREENPAVKAANLALAQFEADRSQQYGQVARGERTVVDITVPEQDLYTREQMNAVLSAVQEIPDLEARVRRIETPAKPGANAAMNSMLRY